MIIINENNLRLLEEKTIECINIENKTQIYIYNCSYNYEDKIQSIRVQIPKNSTDLAKSTCNNLINQNGTSIPEEVFVITDCYIADQSNNVIINGNTNKNIPNNKESTLYLEENGSLEEIPLTFIKKGGINYDMRLTLKKSLESDLNGKSGIVNIDGNNANYILSFKDNSNSSNLDYDYNPGSPVSNSTELDYLFLGADNYHDNGNNEINFFAKYLIENEQDFKRIIFILIIINENNLRLLEEKTIECINIENKTQIYIYNCSYKYEGNIQSIKVQIPKNSTDLAKYTCNNLVKQTGSSIPEEIFVITDCFIADQSKNVIINGNTDKNISNNKESTLYLEDNGSLEEIPLKFIKKEGNNYDMSLTLKKSLESNLDGKSGIVNIDNKNMSYILSFKDNSNSSTLDYDYNPSINKAYIPKKSSGGLSAGAIVGIIIPCIAALLAVLGLAFFLSKSSTGAVSTSTIPMENMGNNTIGISSSTHVVNK